MSKRTLTAILSMFAVLACVGGYTYADIVDVVPGFLTKNEPIVGKPAPDGQPVELGNQMVAEINEAAPAVSAEAVQGAWNALAQAAAEGEYIPSAYVVDALTGDVLLNQRGETGMAPASVTKVLTALTAAYTLDTSKPLTTSVFIDEAGTLHLVGEGDIMLAEGEGNSSVINGRAGISDLAQAVADGLTEKGRERLDGRLVYHDHIFDGPTRDPEVEEDLRRWIGHVAPFAVDRGELPGEGYQPYRENPGEHVAGALQSALEERGISVSLEASDDAYDGHGDLVGAVESATVNEILRVMLHDSDNTLAEQLCRLSAKSASTGSTLQDATDHVEQVVADLGLYNGELDVHDCSGLSLSNRIAPRTIVEALRYIESSDNPGVFQLQRELPTGRFTGTLNTRFEGMASGTRVHAKTGSLSEISSLAGYVTTSQGRPLVFHVQNESSKGQAIWTRPVIDKFVDALASL